MTIRSVPTAIAPRSAIDRRSTCFRPVSDSPSANSLFVVFFLRIYRLSEGDTFELTYDNSEHDRHHTVHAGPEVLLHVARQGSYLGGMVTAIVYEEAMETDEFAEVMDDAGYEGWTRLPFSDRQNTDVPAHSRDESVAFVDSTIAINWCRITAFGIALQS